MMGSNLKVKHKDSRDINSEKVRRLENSMSAVGLLKVNNINEKNCNRSYWC